MDLGGDLRDKSEISTQINLSVELLTQEMTGNFHFELNLAMLNQSESQFLKKISNGKIYKVFHLKSLRIVSCDFDCMQYTDFAKLE